MVKYWLSKEFVSNPKPFNDSDKLLGIYERILVLGNSSTQINEEKKQSISQPIKKENESKSQYLVTNAGKSDTEEKKEDNNIPVLKSKKDTEPQLLQKPLIETIAKDSKEIISTEETKVDTTSHVEKVLTLPTTMGKQLMMEKYKALYKPDKKIVININRQIDEKLFRKGLLFTIMLLRKNGAYALAYMLLKENPKHKKLSIYIKRFRG